MNIKIHKIILGLLLLVLVVFIFQPAFNGKKIVLVYAQIGTPISSCAELQDINLDLTADYYLIQSFSCSGFDYGDGKGFMPIGRLSPFFSGSFDGQDFTITGLFINRSGESYVGLFGRTSSSFTISDVGLVNVNITGDINVGGLIGRNDGIVSNSYSSGDVTGGGVTGGFIGRNDGSISNSYFTGSVISLGNNIGGFIGYSSGVIDNSYSTGSVEGNTWVGGLTGGNLGSISNSNSSNNINGVNRVGGLVGHNFGNISNSYSSGDVTGAAVGGFIGLNKDGITNNSYSTGNVTGGAVAGGFVGRNEASIENSYSIGSVSGSSAVGGFVGEDAGAYTANFWDIETTGTYDDSGNNDDLGDVTGLPTADMIQQSTFTSTGWDFTTVWKIITGSNSYPCFQWQTDETCIFPPTPPIISVLGNFLMGMGF